MELAGLSRSVNYLLEQELSIGTLVTDRHRSVAKWIKDALPGTTHSYDVWHVAKGIHTNSFIGTIPFYYILHLSFLNMYRPQEEVGATCQPKGLCPGW